MAAYLFDTSAIIKRYVSEVGSAWVLGVADPAQGNQIHLAAVTAVEVVSAITRRQRGGSIASVDAALMLAQFRKDLASEYRQVPLRFQLIDRAMLLAEKHALRGYDAVQLAAAVQLNTQRIARGRSALTLISADAELNAAASAEGLIVDDPNAHP